MKRIYKVKTINSIKEDYGAFKSMIDGSINEIPLNKLEGLTTISRSAFQNKENLTEIIFPEGVTRIEKFACSGCSALESVVIPKTLSYVGENAFDYCKKLSKVYISDLEAWCNIEFGIVGYANPLSIQSYLYINNELIEDLVIPEGVTEIAGTFSGAKIKSVKLPSTLTKIGYSTFRQCISLTSVNIPSNVKSISSSAFAECTSLTEVIFNEGLETLYGSAFSDCENLDNIVLPDSLIEIDQRVFEGCDKLSNLIVGPNVSSIGYYAFAYCPKLDIFKIKAKVPPTIQSNTFNNTSLTKIIVPKGCGDAYKSATNWSKFADIVEESTEW